MGNCFQRFWKCLQCLQITTTDSRARTFTWEPTPVTVTGAGERAAMWSLNFHLVICPSCLSTLMGSATRCRVVWSIQIDHLESRSASWVQAAADTTGAEGTSERWYPRPAPGCEGAGMLDKTSNPWKWVCKPLPGHQVQHDDG